MTPQLLLVNPYRTLQGRCVILVHGGLTSGLAAWLSGNSHSTRPRPPLKKAKETLRHPSYVDQELRSPSVPDGKIDQRLSNLETVGAVTDTTLWRSDASLMMGF